MTSEKAEDWDVIDLTSDLEEDPRPPLSQPPLPASSIPLPPPPSFVLPVHPRYRDPPTLFSGTSQAPRIPHIPPLPRAILPPATPSPRPVISQYSSASPYSSSQFELLYSSLPRARPIINFSLLSTREFTIRVQGVLTKELSTSIRSAPGAKFDRDLKKWIFPIELHDRLQVALSSLDAFVEPLPRSTLAAVLLHYQRQVLRSQPDAQRQKIIDGMNALKPGSAQSDQIEKVLPARLYDSLAPFQREGVEFVVKQNEGRAIIADEMGLGKAQPYSSKILTPFGWSVLGNVKAGDVVTSGDGLATTVTGVYPQGLKKIVLVSFSDGISVECCEDHLWKVYLHQEASWKIMSTRELSYYLSAAPSPLIEIPLVKPVHFAENSIPLVISYKVGLFLALKILGIGCCDSLKDAVTFQIDCEEDLKEYQIMIPDYTVQKTASGTHLFSFRLDDVNRTIEWCKLFGVGSESIPMPFLRASVAFRVELLSAVLDAIGQCTSHSHIAVPKVSKSYSESICELVQSLGGTVNRKSIDALEDLEIRMSCNPFSLSRKRRWYEENHLQLQPRRFVSCISHLREDKALCISVSSSDRLYVTDSYAVTHNTIQAIASTAMYQTEWPVLVFTPSSARYHWKSEILKWLSPEVLMEDDLLVVDTAATMALIDHVAHKFLIVSYSILSKFQETILSRKYKVVIADESHYFKNASTQRTKAIVPILQAAARVIMLTGTPALSRPLELFPQLNAIAPMSWSNEKEFIKRYCSGGKSSYGDRKGASNTEELKAILFGTLMISRLKRNILTQLPPKRRHVVSISIKDATIAQRLRSLLRLIKSFRAQNEEPPESLPLPLPLAQPIEGTDSNLTKKAIMMQLFTESGMAKIDSILEHLSGFLDDLMSGKIIIFAHHKSVMDHITKWLKERGADYIRIDGGTISKERQKRIEKFQTLSTCRVALLSITSAGVAITLTAASTVYFAELFWTPASLLQAEDRAHRIGQTAEVNVYYFRAKGSIDDLLWPLLQHKIDTLGEVFDGVKLLDIEQSTPDDPPESDMKPVMSLVNQLAEEECRGTDALNEDDETEDPPAKKLKSTHEEKEDNPPFQLDSRSSSLLASSRPTLDYPSPLATSPIVSSPAQPSPIASEPLDERRMIRAARIKLLREQQLLAQNRPTTQPEVICLLDDVEESEESHKPVLASFGDERNHHSPQRNALDEEEEEETRTAFQLLSDCFHSSEFETLL